MDTQEKEIWLHVGMPKCGSTTIQHYMARHSETNLQNGLCYPQAWRSKGGYRSHLPLAKARADELKEAVAAIAAEAGETPRILLSCEDWTSSVTLGNALPLIDALREAMPDRTVRVVSYFRNVYSFIESSYAQFLKGGLFGIPKHKYFAGPEPRLKRFMNQFEKARGFPLYSALGYAQHLKFWFPKGSLTLRSIEAADLSSGDMIQDLCALLDVPFQGSMASRNTRLSNRKVAELEFIQTLVNQKTYSLLRQDLINMDLSSDPSGDNGRYATLHIDRQLHEKIAATVAAEQSELAALFDTDIKAITEDRWNREKRSATLNPEDRQALAEFADKYR